ncbi:MAG: tRNA (5-methylaminomethyl-2-thiouridine)(34)-methyltransferase MnmD [Flavobacteriaceae bacterium]|nr:tRNA (5-methylaminomethyl-2-thiouridine)(34)-methyltransferase MnmD [Flavobacteriaceae bacterium]
MERKLVLTKDGSSSIFLPEWNEHYHSSHGAIQEAYHVFIRNGLDLFKGRSKINILEIGFGTGLNAFITFLESKQWGIAVDYVGIEAFPVIPEEVQGLNFVEQLEVPSEQHVFLSMHQNPWEIKNRYDGLFFLTKRKQLFQDLTDKDAYDLIYFDAFGARVQPELWTEGIFKKMYEALVTGGVLVTYAAKGSVRRAMLAVGFQVEKLPGPPGKREMLRAKKI